MPFIKPKCANCGKVVDIVSEFTVNDETVATLKCGHFLRSSHLVHSNDPESIVSLDGKKLYKFQAEGVKFVERSGGRCLIGDEMGLGKTIQALSVLYLHEEMRPFLWIGKSSLKYQYQHEVMRWMGEDFFAQVINSGKDVLFPGCAGYIISYDLLRRIPDLAAKCQQANVKTIILDECQQIKNSASQRTGFARQLSQEFPNVIALSGTPIKNNAAEFFPILNILNPSMFNNESRFITNWCDSYFDGYKYKVAGIRDPQLFHNRTKSFIIRRERSEVMPDLPKIQRNFSFHEMGAIVEKEYIATFKQFRDDYNKTGPDASFEQASNILAYLAKMRHLTGLSKVDPCLDHCMEFLGSTDDEKLTIFVHHVDVGELLYQKLCTVLKELDLNPPLKMTSTMDAQQRFDCVESFRTNKKNRILIASTLASGEGLNLQFCSHCILLERQWNPANEEQAESRFPRPGSVASSIEATYFIAVGTVDEFFSELVEQKRQYVHNTLNKNGEAIPWDQSSLMKELAFVLANTGGKKWQI
jgi:SWI/SNF-related matrix-associated actin-dependent regulator 1 of chromatin subfamily A